MNNRFQHISKQITAYSKGQYDIPLRLSSRADEIDAIMGGINMLGEELKAMTISRDYFNSIFHTVSDMVFLLNSKGTIMEVNHSVVEQLEIPLDQLLNQPIRILRSVPERPLFAIIRNLLKNAYNQSGYEYRFQTHTGKSIIVLINAKYLLPVGKEKKLILLTAKDISGQVAAEKAVLRAIIDTQEMERRRLAQDLHDSLGQQLSAIKFFIASTEQEPASTAQRKLLRRSSTALSTIMQDMRNLCFDLMPKTLEEFGLLQAIKECCNPGRISKSIQFRIHPATHWPRLEVKLEIDLYRVVQEFISNSIKHGKPKRINIQFEQKPNEILLLLQDDGKGFKAADRPKGMGLQNMSSRVRSHYGELKWESAPNLGARCRIRIPYSFSDE